MVESEVPARPESISGFRAAMIATAAVAVLVALVLGPDEIPFASFSYDDVIRLLASAAVIAALIERANQIIVNVLWAGSKAKLEDAVAQTRDQAEEPLRRAESAAAGYEEQALRETDPGETRKLRAEAARLRQQTMDPRLAGALREAEGKLRDWRAVTERYTLMIGFVLGVVAAALGVRLVMPLLDGRVIDDLTRLHRQLLVAFDVIVTGALLGGGASVLHSMIDLFQKKLDRGIDTIRNERLQAARGGRP